MCNLTDPLMYRPISLAVMTIRAESSNVDAEDVN